MAIIGNANYYIFTGGPGSGKSTVLNILENMGYMTVREVARDIIKNQVRTNGDAVPWNNTVRYSNLMLLTFWALKKEYEKFGYNTVDVPFLTPQKRAEWVLERL